MDGLPRAYFGPVGYRIMVARVEVEARAEANAAAIHEVEEDLRLGPSQ